MRILCLCKRRPQGRDLITRPYGRFFHLPYHLSRMANQVSFALLSYSDDPPLHIHQHSFDWYSESLRPAVANRGPGRYIQRVQTLIDDTKPEWIVGFSDLWYGVLAQHLGARYGIKTLIDAYDNYESYMPWAKPLHWAWRRACRQATALTAAGPELLRLMAQERLGVHTAVIPMAADPIFQPMDRDECRSRLGLPTGIPLVGYCGSLFRSRGVNTLFDVIRHIPRLIPGTRFVLSGRRQSGVAIPADIKDSIIDLGCLPDDHVPLLLNSMNVMLAVSRPSSFGSYSYPVKIYEAMQCGVPVVATAVGGARWILGSRPESLVSYGDALMTAERVRDAMTREGRANAESHGWDSSASRLLSLLLDYRE